jgi:branched-chain amino acid transport system permease protein
MIDSLTAMLLIQDGLTTGVVYALLALSMILVFAVTRVLFIAQGEIVAFAALSVAAMDQGQVPGTAYVVLVLGACCAIADIYVIVKQRLGGDAEVAASGAADLGRRVGIVLLKNLIMPGAVACAAIALAPGKPNALVSCALTIAMVTSLGPMIYRLAFERIADASPLALLFVSVAVHYVLLSIGLSSFGAEGWRTQPLLKMTIDIGPLSITGQAIVVWSTVAVLIVGLWLFFTRSYLGRVLIATARNRKGAKLMGIRPELAGKVAFGFATGIGALSGILISPTITIYYDSGFLIVLKGLVAAVIGAMASYPIATLGALIVGVTESFAAYSASTFKEAIVFLLLVPFLLWMSLRTGRVFEADED